MVDAPLTAVVNVDAIAKYRAAFHMLWKLKRVEWTLSSSWKQLMCFTHTRGSDLLPRLKPVLHRCTLHRARMTHVVNNLCAFLMFEVIETAWVALQHRVAHAQCLDEVIQAHSHYLDEIHDRALLTSRHESLNMQIQQMLVSVLRFCSLEETLILDALASIARRRALSAAVDRRTASGGWGVSETETEFQSDGLADQFGMLGSEASFDMSGARTNGGRNSFSGLTVGPGSVDGVPGYVITRLEEAASEYSRQFGHLMAMLREQGDKAGDIVRYLTFRLDFNEYYSNTEYTTKASAKSSSGAGAGGGDGDGTGGKKGSTLNTVLREAAYGQSGGLDVSQSVLSASTIGAGNSSSTSIHYLDGAAVRNRTQTRPTTDGGRGNAGAHRGNHS